MDKDDIKIICEFDCNGITMIVVRLENSIHVMPLNEWKWTKKHLRKRKNKTTKYRVA